jgi:hypothetical protein
MESWFSNVLSHRPGRDPPTTMDWRPAAGNNEFGDRSTSFRDGQGSQLKRCNRRLAAICASRLRVTANPNGVSHCGVSFVDQWLRSTNLHTLAMRPSLWFNTKDGAIRQSWNDAPFCFAGIFDGEECASLGAANS